MLDKITINNKVICVGRNYAEHAVELRNSIPEKEPVLFMKPLCSLVNLEEKICFPDDLGEVHYETEIFLRLNKDIGYKHIIDRPLSFYISEIGIALDLTLRGIQKQLKSCGLPWEKSKSFDASCPISKPITADINKLDDVSFMLSIDGAIRQKGYIKEMIFPPKTLLQKISNHFSMKKDDIILTGTPAGTGVLEKNKSLNLRINMHEVTLLNINTNT